MLVARKILFYLGCPGRPYNEGRGEGASHVVMGMSVPGSGALGPGRLEWKEPGGCGQRGSQAEGAREPRHACEQGRTMTRPVLGSEVVA